MHQRTSVLLVALCCGATSLLAFSSAPALADDSDSDTIKELREDIADRDELIAVLRKAVAEKDERIAQLEKAALQPHGTCITVADGRVGESGASATVHHFATRKSRTAVVLENVRTSLCGNTGAIGVLVVNGIPVSCGSLTAVGSSIQADVSPGDLVVGLVSTVPLFNDIVCFRLGEMHFELQECELQK